jgi:hypothetical protein
MSCGIFLDKKKLEDIEKSWNLFKNGADTILILEALHKVFDKGES